MNPNKISNQDFNQAMMGEIVWVFWGLFVGIKARDWKFLLVVSLSTILKSTLKFQNFSNPLKIGLSLKYHKASSHSKGDK